VDFMTIRIMTWNIRTGNNWQAVATFAKLNRVEIMGFQEVDNNFRETTKSLNACKTIAGDLGFYWAYCPSIELNDNNTIRQYGNCIVSKFPILEDQRHFLSPEIYWNGKDAETEPRTLLEASIKIFDKTLCFMTLHLAYSREFVTTDVKIKQIETVVNIIRKNERRPTILLGDFNSLPRNREIREIEKYLINTDRTACMPTWTMHDFDFQGWRVSKGLRYKIDYVFLSKDIEYKILGVSLTEVSDHLPIILDIRF